MKLFSNNSSYTTRKTTIPKVNYVLTLETRKSLTFVEMPRKKSITKIKFNIFTVQANPLLALWWQLWLIRGACNILTRWRSTGQNLDKMARKTSRWQTFWDTKEASTSLAPNCPMKTPTRKTSKTTPLEKLLRPRRQGGPMLVNDCTMLGPETG